MYVELVEESDVVIPLIDTQFAVGEHFCLEGHGYEDGRFDLEKLQANKIPLCRSCFSDSESGILSINEIRPYPTRPRSLFVDGGTPVYSVLERMYEEDPSFCPRPLAMYHLRWLLSRHLSGDNVLHLGDEERKNLTNVVFLVMEGGRAGSSGSRRMEVTTNQDENGIFSALCIEELHTTVNVHGFRFFFV